MCLHDTPRDCLGKQAHKTPAIPANIPGTKKLVLSGLGYSEFSNLEPAMISEARIQLP
jgi:hypothetical protein